MKSLISFVNSLYRQRVQTLHHAEYDQGLHFLSTGISIKNIMKNKNENTIENISKIENGPADNDSF